MLSQTCHVATRELRVGPEGTSLKRALIQKQKPDLFCHIVLSVTNVDILRHAEHKCNMRKQDGHQHHLVDFLLQILQNSFIPGYKPI